MRDDVQSVSGALAVADHLPQIYHLIKGDDSKPMPDLAIEVTNLSKCYKIYTHPVDRILDWLTPSSQRHSRDFWALRNLSFTVAKGAAVGIIGANGAGKSTLLKIIAGTTRATSGYVRVEGKVAALLELGMGFHPEFTGRQNIKLNGKLLGLGDDELEEKIPQIVAFSELGDFIDQPLRTYSSGMFVRLGFAVVASVEPDILIVDEALSVGDTHFQQKCIRRIREFHEQGTTLLFVSHDPGAVKTLCREAILLDEGEIVSRGAPDEILDHYNALVAKKSVRETSFHIERISSAHHLGVRHSGNFMAIITEAGIRNEKGVSISAVVSGRHTRIYVKVFFFDDVLNPTIGFLIKDRLGNEIFGTNTYMLGEELGLCRAGELLEVNFPLRLDIGAGEYTLTAAAHTLDYHIYECYDWADKLLLFTVVPSSDFRFQGVAKCYPTITHKKARTEPAQARALLEEIFHDADSQLPMAPKYQKFLCKGWYECERGKDEYVRWTDDKFSFFLRVKGRNLAIDLACPKPDIKSTPLTATLLADGNKLGSFTLKRPQPQTIRIPLPESLNGKLVLFSIALNTSWSPADYGDSDDRKLGIVVRKIWTEEEAISQKGL